MFNFIKAFFIVAVFYALILFSFLWFNKGEKEISEVPYVQNFFSLIKGASDWVGERNIDNLNLNIFSNNREDLNNEGPFLNSEDWDDFLNE
jgi:hypothetical protein